MSNSIGNITFEIVDVKLSRRQRGTEWIRVAVLEDKVIVDYLWMSEHHIKMNKKDHGGDSFINDLKDFL